MSAAGVIVVDVLSQGSREVPLVEDDHVVETLAANATNHPFDVRILPWRARRRPNLVDAESRGTDIAGSASSMRVVFSRRAWRIAFYPEPSVRTIERRAPTIVAPAPVQVRKKKGAARGRPDVELDALYFFFPFPGPPFDVSCTCMSRKSHWPIWKVSEDCILPSFARTS